MFANLKIQLALLLLTAPVASAVAQSAAVPQDVKVGEKLLYVLANQERVQRGLQPLQWDQKLAAAALNHAQWMARRADISHQFSGEPDLTARANQAGAHFSAIAENVAIVSEIQSAHTEWMQSPGHRANLLDPKLNAVGIAFEMRDGRFYVVQDFSLSTASLSLAEQEQHVAKLIRNGGVTVSNAEQSVQAARRTCALSNGSAGPTRHALEHH
jgi:uncharacterized protein YkwD